MADNMNSDGYSNRLLDGLRDLQTSDALCDLTLTADNYSVKVHRAVLAASSDYFRALLTVDMREKDQPEIRLQGVPGKGLKEIIRFIYTGKLGCTLDNVTDVLLAASHVQQIDALGLCCRYLIQLTTPQNSVDMFNTSEQFNLPALKDKAVSLILSHFDEIASKDDFLRFSPNFLAELLGDNRLKMFSELNLYKLVLRWIRYDEINRLSHLYPLMSRVRFPLIQPTELVTEVMSERLMKMDPQCLELIFEANTYHLLPHMQALLQSERTQLRNNVASLVMLDVDDEGPRVFDLGCMSWTTMRNTKVAF
jgi:kelch-like protein 9/13